jgi:hypothetical protein
MDPKLSMREFDFKCWRPNSLIFWMLKRVGKINAPTAKQHPTTRARSVKWKGKKGWLSHYTMHSCITVPQKKCITAGGTRVNGTEPSELLVISTVGINHSAIARIKWLSLSTCKLNQVKSAVNLFSINSLMSRVLISNWEIWLAKYDN